MLWGRPGGRFAGSVHFWDDTTHICPYSNEELVKICEKAGFKVVKYGITRNLLHLIFSPVLLLAGFLLPRKLYFMYARNSIFGTSPFVVLCKPNESS